MTGYGASALNSPDCRLLVVVPNWLGDGIMAMPALQELRSRMHAEATLTVAARPNQCGLWEMQPDVSSVLSLPAETGKLVASARLLKAGKFTHAVILPHSFRSALLPALARIPCRRGTVLQGGRRLLINSPVSLKDDSDRHQQWEIARLLLPDDLPQTLPPPRLLPPESALKEAQALLQDLPKPWLGCIPGAARGPSKQWPGDRFQAVAQNWIGKTGGSVCWLGTPADAALCENLNQPFGNQGVNFAGKTSLKSFTALLSLLDHALVNDSGGMHLAAAVGTPLTAIFGTTDPGKTGPLSPETTVLQHSETKDRAIARNSSESQAALARVTTEEAVQAVLAKPASSL